METAIGISISSSVVVIISYSASVFSTLTLLNRYPRWHLGCGKFLPVRHYASTGLCDSDVSVRPSVCLSVRPPRTGIVPSRAKAGS